MVWKFRGSSKLDGFLYGKIDGLGGLTGSDVLFVYPDFETGLFGTFDNDELVVGRAVDIVGEKCVEGVKQVEVVEKEDGDTVWERTSEGMDRKHMGRFATVMDPFEKKSVYVSMSSIPGAGEGLFARSRMTPGDLVSYFGGWKTFHSSMVFNNMSMQEMDTALAFSYSIGREAEQKWNYHKVRKTDLSEQFKLLSPRNTDKIQISILTSKTINHKNLINSIIPIMILQDLILDIPSGFRSISAYRTTLGHKANHKFGQLNTDFVVVDHPVLGGTLCKPS